MRIDAQSSGSSQLWGPPVFIRQSEKILESSFPSYTQWWSSPQRDWSHFSVVVFACENGSGACASATHKFKAAPAAVTHRFIRRARVCSLVKSGVNVCAAGKMVALLSYKDCLGGRGYGCLHRCAEDVFMCMHADSLRAGCAVFPEGCSLCLWGSDSPHW